MICIVFNNSAQGVRNCVNTTTNEHYQDFGICVLTRLFRQISPFIYAKITFEYVVEKKLPNSGVRLS